MTNATSAIVSENSNVAVKAATESENTVAGTDAQIVGSDATEVVGTNLANDPAAAIEQAPKPTEKIVIDPMARVHDQISGKTTVEYTREQLMDARTFVLKLKQSTRKSGFGDKAGPMIRETVGYKFDSMDIMDMLREMAKPDFMGRYKAVCAKWLTGVKHDDSTTGKSNIAKSNGAMALFDDKQAYATLVWSLLVLCQRNQDWREKGDHLDLSYNGHRAVLDLLGVNITNNRRLKLNAM